MKPPRYPKLPVMTCEPSCGECCTVVPATQAEFDAVGEYAHTHGIKPIPQGMKCPWYQNGGCTVHPVRPGLCRLFGHVPDMECPRGHNVNIPRKEEKKWRKLMQGASRFLHQMIPGWTPEKAGIPKELIEPVMGTTSSGTSPRSPRPLRSPD